MKLSVQIFLFPPKIYITPIPEPWLMVHTISEVAEFNIPTSQGESFLRITSSVNVSGFPIHSSSREYDLTALKSVFSHLHFLNFKMPKQGCWMNIPSTLF
jgi:hypothetical protein